MASSHPHTARTSFAALLILLATVLTFTGCAGTHDTRFGSQAGVSFEGQRAVTPALPLEAARARLDAARAHDATLRLGFYQVPAPLAEDEPDVALADLRREVAPESWRAPGREVYRDEGWLVAIQSPAVHRAIAGWAKERRAADLAARQLVETEVRVLMFEGESAAPLVARLGLQPVVTENGAPAYLVDPSQIPTLLAARGVRAVSAPRVVALSGQRANIAVLNQHAYIADYEVYQLEDALIADPQIDVLQEGLSVELTATVEEDRIRLETAVHLAHLLAMESTEVVLDPSLDPVHLDLPQVSIQRIDTTARIADGQALLVGPGLAHRPLVTDENPAGEVPWVIVRPSKVDPVR